MNIIEAYIKFNEELIIIISGLSGSGKSKVASFIERDFKIKKIDIESFCIKNNNRTVTLRDKEGKEVTVTDWDHIESYDWKSINKEVNKYKKNGVVICGPYFPSNVIDFAPNFHVHIKISKQKLIENRHNYIKDHKEDCADLYELLDTPFEHMIVNQITYPHYLKYMEESDKNIKYINTKNLDGNYLSIDQIYDQAFDYLINKVQEYINEYNRKLLENKQIDNHNKPEKKYKDSVNDIGETVDQEDVYDIYNIDKPSDIENITTEDLRDTDTDSSEIEYIGTTY